MNKNDLFRIFSIEDLSELPGAIMPILIGDLAYRDEVYGKLASLNNYDFSFDWFQSIYEDELAQRKQNKQDFTPKQIGQILSSLTGSNKGRIFEPTAGNGSLLISNWWHRCKSRLPWEHRPSEHMVECWELSNRSIPILLLNLSIRA